MHRVLLHLYIRFIFLASHNPLSTLELQSIFAQLLIIRVLHYIQIEFLVLPTEIIMIRIASEAEVLSYFKTAYCNRRHKYFGFYNSHANTIVTDQSYMVLPVDDRGATRAHGVFDVIYLKNFKLINLQQHINRLIKSAESASIPSPFNEQRMTDVVKEVVQKTVDFHLRNDPEGKNKSILQSSVGVRLTISSGFGDFSVSSLGKQPILYIVVFQPYISQKQIKQGVSEYVTKTVKQPKQLVHSKTLDYIENALMANISKAKGGYQGIKALQNGVLLQAAMANIAFVFGKQFATPRFQTVIKGTTITKSLTFVQKLIDDGVLQKISFRDITIEQGQKADQMIIFGGDKVVPVLKFNDVLISQKRGKITEMIQEWYESTIDQGTPIKVNLQLL